MKKSALNFDTEEAPIFVETAAPVQKPDVSKIIVYQPEVRPPASIPKRSSEKESRRRKLVRFIKLEAVACFFLILALAGATNESLRKADVDRFFEVGMIVAALAVAIIPVVFYGSTRQRYRYRSRRYRRR